MTIREICLIAGGAAAGFIAAITVVVLGLEPLIRATGRLFDVTIEDQPVVLTEQAVLFQDEMQIGRIDPGLIAIRSTSREKFDDYELKVVMRRDVSPRVAKAGTPLPFLTARSVSSPASGDR